MQLDYEPLLKIQREIQALPRDRDRFRHYLRTIWNCYAADFELIPLMIANPMARDHVTAILDELLAMGADQIGADAAREASAKLSDLPGDYKAAVVVADDLKGGWTNRYDWEFKLRFGFGPEEVRCTASATEPVEFKPPRWSRYFWVMGVLWSSDAPSRDSVREAMLTAAYRTAFQMRHGAPQTLRDMLHQEGEVLAAAGCTRPALDPDDIAYTREVLAPFLDASDMRSCVECLFGDAAARTLGFTPRGLSHWAGVALALYDAQSVDSTRA